ncbi:hypothetical protein BC830DRAFT_1077443 [Chytriomyces sp. MP71]|nr:hypothetical protein BC830DRAFT_1077443 [Chytriomyces sp. MP71]
MDASERTTPMAPTTSTSDGEATDTDSEFAKNVAVHEAMPSTNKTKRGRPPKRPSNIATKLNDSKPKRKRQPKCKSDAKAVEEAQVRQQRQLEQDPAASDPDLLFAHNSLATRLVTQRRRFYTQDQKAKVATYACVVGRNCAAKELGLSQPMVGRWIKTLPTETVASLQEVRLTLPTRKLPAASRDPKKKRRTTVSLAALANGTFGAAFRADQPENVTNSCRETISEQDVFNTDALAGLFDGDLVDGHDIGDAGNGGDAGILENDESGEEYEEAEEADGGEDGADFSFLDGSLFAAIREAAFSVVAEVGDGTGDNL